MKRLALVCVVIASIGLGACGEGKGSSSIDDENTGPASIIDYPRGFRNVAHKCDGHGHRVFSTSRGNDAESNVPGGVAVIADASCESSAP